MKGQIKETKDWATSFINGLFDADCAANFINSVAGNFANTVEKVQEAEVEDYAVSVDAQEVAVQAEIENAEKAVEEIQEVAVEDDGSNDDSDEDEEKVNVDYNFEEDDLRDAYGDWKEKVKPYTYHVMALNAKGVLTFDGKRISKDSATNEIHCACNRLAEHYSRRYATRRAVLITDKNVGKYLDNFFLKNCEEAHKRGYMRNVKIVDFGRDEVPYINNKVTKIIDGYKQKAREEDMRKAAEIAYRASLEYELEKSNKFLKQLNDEVFFVKEFIEQEQSRILDYIGYIAAREDEIQEYGLKIDEFNAAIEKEEAEKKAILDKIYMRDAFKNINEIAAEIEDDGSNDDLGEEEINVDYTFGNDGDEDDELEDENLIIEFDSEKFSEKLLQAAIMEYAPVEMVQFDLQAFNDSVNIADCPATIDTAVSGTFNAINHDAEIEEAIANIKNFKKSIKTNKRDISHYENKIYKAELIIREAQQRIERAKANIATLNDYVAESVATVRILRPTEYWDLTAEKLTAEFNKIPYEDSDEELMKVMSTDGQVYSLPRNFGDLSMQPLSGKMLIMLNGKALAGYMTVEELDSAMTGLMTAIRRGDSEYTFPNFDDEEFDNESLAQLVGYDDDGKEIYEGDEIIKSEKMLEVKVAKVLYGDAYKNLAELKGSAKQVDWASDIRESKIAEIFINEACIKNPFMGKVLLNVFKRQDSSGFWIDNRDRDVVTIAMGVKMLGIAGLRDDVLAEKSNLESAVGNIDEYNKNFVETEMRRLYNVKEAYFAKGDELAASTGARTPEEKEQKRIVNLVWFSAKVLLDDYKKVYPDVDFETTEPLKSDNAVDDKQIADLAKTNFYSTTADSDEEFDNESLAQLVGYDDDGKEIYEGDEIIKSEKMLELNAEFDKELKELSEKALELDDKRTRFKGKARDKVADKLDEVIETLDEKSEIVDEWFKKQFTFNGKNITLKYCNRELELNEEVFNEEISASCTVYGQIGIFHEKEHTMHAIHFYDTLNEFQTEVLKISAAIKRSDSEYIIEGK